MSRKGAKSRTRVTGLRSTGTKAGTPVALSGGPQAALIKKLKARAHDLERKLSEALEQQTATSEVLSIISRSPGYLQLVFDAMLENAVRLCAAKFGILWLAESDGFRSVALYGLPPALDELRRREPFVKFGPLTGIGRVLQTKQVFHVDDMKDFGIFGARPARQIPRRAWGRPHCGFCPAAQGQRCNWCAGHLPPGSPSVHR